MRTSKHIQLSSLKICRLSSSSLLSNFATSSLVNFTQIMLSQSISSFLSSNLEKASEVLSIGRIQTLLGFVFALCLSFALDFFNLLLVRFHQAEIIAVKHVIQGRNSEAWWELNHQHCDCGLCKNDAPNHSAALLTSF